MLKDNKQCFFFPPSHLITTFAGDQSPECSDSAQLPHPPTCRSTNHTALSTPDRQNLHTEHQLSVLIKHCSKHPQAALNTAFIPTFMFEDQNTHIFFLTEACSNNCIRQVSVSRLIGETDVCACDCEIRSSHSINDSPLTNQISCVHLSILCFLAAKRCPTGIALSQLLEVLEEMTGLIKSALVQTQDLADFLLKGDLSWYVFLFLGYLQWIAVFITSTTHTHTEKQRAGGQNISVQILYCNDNTFDQCDID